MKSRRYIVRGRVQGVWFRAAVQEGALNAGFSGYVRNLPDGTVEAAVSCLNMECFEAFEALLRKGSERSIVESLGFETIDEVFEGAFERR